MAKKTQHRSYPELLEHLVDPDPLVQFRHWYRDASEAGIPHAEAMILATATPDGRPSARVVLMKKCDNRGFVFFTNYESRKGEELRSNPAAALVFYWETLGRQVRVEGAVEKITVAESDVYFASRPKENQLSSLSSSQSRPADRDSLDRRFEALEGRYAGRTIPRPPYWGGYRLGPSRIEFWQRRYARLNDRILYERSSDGQWVMRRLAP